MTEPSPHVDVRAFAGMAGAISAAILVAVLAVRSAPEPGFWSGREAYRRLAAARHAIPGVRATLSAGDVVLVRRFRGMRFRLEPGRALDASLPTGPFRAVFEVTFDPGLVRSARLGADFQGGSIIVRRGAEVILADATGDEPRRAMSTFAYGVGPGSETIEIEFVSAAGEGAAALCALWQPMGSTAPSPLPGAGEDGMLPGAVDPR